MKAKICDEFHEEIIDLLIEPDEKIIQKWTPHLKECKKCNTFFEENQQEQKQGKILISELFDYVPSLPNIEPSMSVKKNSYIHVVYIAAGILLCLGLFKVQFFLKNKETWQEKIATIQQEHFPHINGEQKQHLAKAFKNYGFNFSKEAFSIKKIAELTDQHLENTFIPFLQKRLLFNCRIYLYTIDDEIFKKLEKQKDDLPEIKLVFSRAINSIAINPKSKQVISQFFLKVTPNLRRIKKNRVELTKEMEEIFTSNTSVNKILWKLEMAFINTIPKGE